MRLIDADALYEKVKKAEEELMNAIKNQAVGSMSWMQNNGALLEVMRFRYDICDAPTIDLESTPITYTNCSNALLMMWMDNVLTDDEYNSIIDKLNLKKKSN